MGKLFYATWTESYSDEEEMYLEEGHYHTTKEGAMAEALEHVGKEYRSSIEIADVEEKEIDFYAVMYDGDWFNDECEIYGYFPILPDAIKFVKQYQTEPIYDHVCIVACEWGQPIDLDEIRKVILD